MVALRELLVGGVVETEGVSRVVAVGGVVDTGGACPHKGTIAEITQKAVKCRVSRVILK